MRRMWSEDSPWFRVWLVFCVLVGLIVIGVWVWGLAIVVQFVTR